MATSKRPLSAMKTLGDTKPIPPAPTEAQLRAFGNFANTTDIKEKASYLSKKGLIGAGQLMTDHPDISTKNGIINAQSDWKTSAMSSMLSRARQLGLKTPTEINANKEALLGALAPRLKDAMNHPAFNQIHPNYWDTFNSVLKDQYANELTSKPLPSLTTSLATK